ncbi:MAG: hypothetical protein HY238_21860 [Acidobacteria bacterium]|nr:hypothetical protein [Acidobacteriota bacterium]
MRPFAIPLRILLSLAAVAILGYACFWTLRLGYADHLYHSESAEDARRAAKLVPASARYQARWAAMLDRSGKDPAASLAALEAALACNLWDSSSWIDLGLRAEMDQDFANAESSLLEAAHVDKQYDPRWTLVNFYFRRNDPEKFWLWARQAAAISYGDPAPLFRLCWRVTQDPAVILERAIPPQPQILLRYLAFLLADNHLDGVEEAAQRAAKYAGREDLPVLFASCDRLLGAQQLPGALRIWSALCERRLLPYPAPDPGRGWFLTNGDFGVSPVSHGFDWRVHPPEGVSCSRDRSPLALRVTFSGKQPESCEIMNQFVPLLPGRQYRFRFRYRTSGIGPHTGLRWRVFDAATGAELGDRSPYLSSEDQTTEDLPFATPPGVRLARVVLAYQRALGTTRIEGSAFLSDTSLGFARR